MLPSKLNRYKPCIRNHLRLNQQQFFALKITTPPVYDIVLAGSSRVYRGLCPSEMSKSLPGYRIFNFGFSSCILGREYLSKALSLLRLNNQNRPHLIIGISPHCLLARKPERCGFNQWLEKRINREKYLRAVATQNINILSQLNKTKRVPYWRLIGATKEHFCIDGWVATKVIRHDPLDYVRRLEPIYSNRKIDCSVVDNMLITVKYFTERGIHVWGFRPPTNSDMVALENSIAGLQYSSIIKEFIAAGGNWLDIQSKNYYSYDGSHLDRQEARKMSSRIAMQIKTKILSD